MATTNDKKYGSGMTRLLKPSKYPTNKAIVLLTPATGAVALFYRLAAGDNIGQSLYAAVGAAAACYLGWVITRELDPDHDYSAFVAAILSVLGVMIFDVYANWIAATTVLLMARIVNRTTGVKITRDDAVVVLILAIWLAATDLWVIGVLASAAFLLDGVLVRPGPYGRVAAGITLLAVLVTVVITDNLDWDFALTNSDFAVLILGLIVTRFVIPNIPPEMVSVGDRTKQPLDRQRVVSALSLMTLTAMLVSWSGGGDEVTAILPLVAGLAGVVIWLAGEKLNVIPQKR